MLNNPAASGLRDYLRRIFALSTTKEDRFMFIGSIGRRFLIDPDNNILSNDLYILTLAVNAILKSSLLVGILLIFFFNYLAANGLDANAYTTVLYSNDASYMRSSGITGLYFYYYSEIMGPVVSIIAWMCFALFLIHVKPGEINPLRNDPILKLKENRTFKNLAGAFIRSAIMGALMYYLVVVSRVGFMPLLVEDGFNNLSSAGTLIWEIIIFTLELLAHIFGVMSIYGALMMGWSIFFRYDEAYDEIHKF